MSRGSGIYERAILAALIAPWQKREKCRCYRCIEGKTLAIIERQAGRTGDFANMRRSFRRALRNLTVKGVVVICDGCGTVQLWDETDKHRRSTRT